MEGYLQSRGLLPEGPLSPLTPSLAGQIIESKQQQSSSDTSVPFTPPNAAATTAAAAIASPEPVVGAASPQTPAPITAAVEGVDVKFHHETPPRDPAATAAALEAASPGLVVKEGKEDGDGTASLRVDTGAAASGAASLVSPGVAFASSLRIDVAAVSVSPASRAYVEPAVTDWITVEDDFSAVWGMNVTHAASDMHTAPVAHWSDGFMDLLVMRRADSSCCSLLGIFLDIEKGEHLHHDPLHYVKVKGVRLTPIDSGSGRVSLLGIDGERIPYKPLELRVWRGILNFICR